MVKASGKTKTEGNNSNTMLIYVAELWCMADAPTGYAGFVTTDEEADGQKQDQEVERKVC